MFLRENPWAWAEEKEYFWWFVSCFQFLYPSNKQVEKCGCCEAVFLISSENHKQFHHGVPVILRQILILLLLTPSYVAHLVEVERVDGAGPWDVDQSGDCRPQDAVVPQTGHPDRHQDQSCRETIKQRTSYVGVCRKAATTQQAVGKCSFSPACHQTVACVSGALGPQMEKKRVEDSENEPSALMMWDVVLTIIDPESLNESVYYQLNLEPLMLVD